MHINRTPLVLALIALPALAGAQRGVNIKGERAGDIGGRGFQMPRSSDLADHSPVGVVLEKKKKLALTDSQVTALKAVAKGLQEKNAASYRGWDSGRVTMRAARAHMMSLLRVIREHDEWSRQAALKLLTVEQQPKAESYWKDDADGFGRSLPAAGTPGGGRPDGGRPPAR